MFLSNKPDMYIKIVLSSKEPPEYKYFLRLPDKSYSSGECTDFTKETLLSYSIDQVKEALCSLLNHYDDNILAHYNILVYAYESSLIEMKDKIYYIPVNAMQVLRTFNTVEEVKLFLRS